MARMSVEEMLHQFSVEEWRNKIEAGMAELGLMFNDKPLDEQINLFPESGTDQICLREGGVMPIDFWLGLFGFIIAGIIISRGFE